MLFTAALLVLMLTTAGEAARAAPLKPLVLPVECVGAADSSTGTTVGRLGRRSSHCGLSVATTKKAASSTVTDWAKTSQSRFMGGFEAKVLLADRSRSPDCAVYGCQPLEFKRLDPRQGARAVDAVQ